MPLKEARSRELARLSGGRRLACGACGEPITFERYGKGRHLGEHPDHLHNDACGCDLTWHGLRWVDVDAKPTGVLT